ncbi:MAG: hypothetical protein IKV25_07410 [Clostridia bacterium]|nr:hypothetical protein [Clostridia bacterium]
MSKEKQPKNLKKKEKLTGFDIMYKVVTIVLIVAMFPLFYFTNFVYIQMDHTQIADLWGSITQTETPELGITYEELSLSELPELIDVLSSFGISDSSVNIWSYEHFRPAIVAAGFLALALVIGLVIVGFAIFSKKLKVIISLSAAGFVSTIISLGIFNEAFAKPIIDGTVSLTELLKVDNIIGSLALQYIGEISAISLREAFFSVMFILLSICLWSLCVLLVNASEENEKKQLKK